MKPFNQDESAYTATAKSIVFSADDEYDADKLDNPVRSKVNYAITLSNTKAYRKYAAI